MHKKNIFDLYNEQNKPAADPAPGVHDVVTAEETQPEIVEGVEDVTAEVPESEKSADETAERRTDENA